VVTDLDPPGDAMAADLVKSFRRDYGVRNIEAFKVAMTIEQVEEFALLPSMDAKPKSPTYSAFVARYGERIRVSGVPVAYELEAMEPADLVETLESAIEAVMDIDRYNEELQAEETDSAQIVSVRKQAEQFFKSLNL